MSDYQREQKGLTDLLGDLARNGTALVEREFDLLRAELQSNLARMFSGLAAMIAAAVFFIVALALLAESAVEALARVVGSEALSALIIAVAALMIAAALVAYAKASLRVSVLTPRRTRRSLERDKDMLSEKAMP